jgi:hypothetical protein
LARPTPNSGRIAEWRALLRSPDAARAAPLFAAWCAADPGP